MLYSKWMDKLESDLVGYMLVRVRLVIELLGCINSAFTKVWQGTPSLLHTR